MEKDLVSAVQDGDQREALVAIRDRLGGELAAASGKDAAAIARELRATIAEIEGLPGGEESKLDELAAAREARRADAASR
ncbi:hypothetical protein OG339_42285 [Streptosporangium sp. NBC_01495]|uniref:hypothetical protein n=1 Tax=Streptosporangium sp. NBC_01495 TaxID=2903899 RepID=UPI002E304543|nr:hypothetical protein [Streptosporangium sp. NBC_01495]